MKFEDIKVPLRNVLEAIHKDRSKIIYGQPNMSITAQSLESAIGNHMCDDNPEWFGITKDEGHQIRQYFQETGFSYGWGDYISLLHKEFPDLMDEEDPKYIQRTNKERKRNRLPAIKL